MPLTQVQETLSRVPEEYLAKVNEYLISLINTVQQKQNMQGLKKFCGKVNLDIDLDAIRDRK